MAAGFSEEGELISIIVGTVVALAALAYVLHPLLFGAKPQTDADARDGDKSADRTLGRLRPQDQPPSTVED